MQKTLMVGGLAALTLAAAGVAFAQQAPDRGMRVDSNGDRRFSQTEFVDRRVERLAAADADRDGQVTSEERRAAREAHMAARAGSRFDRLDADKDGSISRAEFEAAGERREARGDRGDRPARAERAARADRPARAERRRDRGPIVIAEARARAEETFTRLDADNDGFVSAGETRAARETMREQRRERSGERRAARQAQRQASPQASASE